MSSGSKQWARVRVDRFVLASARDRSGVRGGRCRGLQCRHDTFRCRSVRARQTKRRLGGVVYRRDTECEPWSEKRPKADLLTDVRPPAITGRDNAAVRVSALGDVPVWIPPQEAVQPAASAARSAELPGKRPSPSARAQWRPRGDLLRRRRTRQPRGDQLRRGTRRRPPSLTGPCTDQSSRASVRSATDCTTAASQSRKTRRSGRPRMAW